MKKKGTKKPRTNYEIMKSIRNDWGTVNPVTKVIPDKRNRKPKHRKGWEDEQRTEKPD